MCEYWGIHGTMPDPNPAPVYLAAHKKDCGSPPPGTNLYPLIPSSLVAAASGSAPPTPPRPSSQGWKDSFTKPPAYKNLNTSAAERWPPVQARYPPTRTGVSLCAII